MIGEISDRRAGQDALEQGTLGNARVHSQWPSSIIEYIQDGVCFGGFYQIAAEMPLFNQELR